MTRFPWCRILVFGMATAVMAQEAGSAYELKAAYLYNFSKNTEWPTAVLPRATSTISVCVFKGDDEFTQALRRIVGERKVGEHPVAIRNVRLAADLRLCQVAFFWGPIENWRSALKDVRDADVLTVGEDNRFLAEGGMINLSLVNGAVHTEVNAAAMARSGVRCHETGSDASEHPESALAPQGTRPLRFSSPPVFPEIARKMNIRGAVQLEAVVGPDGKVKEIHVLGGHPVLAEAATRAVKQWRYKPQNRESREIVKVSFSD